MSKEADIRAKVTPELKEQFSKVLEAIGLTPSVAIGMFANQVVQCQGLPFTPHIVRQPNKETLEALQDVENKSNLIDYESVDKMFDTWDADLKDNA